MLVTHLLFLKRELIPLFYLRECLSFIFTIQFMIRKEAN